MREDPIWASVIIDLVFTNVSSLYTVAAQNTDTIYSKNVQSHSQIEL